MSVRILVGDCRERLAELPDDSIDSVVCDPPYHLTSIVKRFGSENAAPAKVGKTGAYARASKGFMGQTWDGGDVAFDPETWRAILRVMKPGAHLVAFSGTRTYHRMAVAIEDAGFDIRDQLAWIYGSGFPKSHNLEGEWEGWGSALKPAWEPICLAQKPRRLSIAANMAEHRTGALNIDACRIHGADAQGGDYTVKRLKPGATLEKTGGNWRPEDGVEYHGTMKPGRWPANLIHDGSDEVVSHFPAEAGAAAPVTKRGSDKFRNTYGAFAGNRDEEGSTFQGDSGSAARFFYEAKASADERGEGNDHPTVKPRNLMRWLCQLITPPGGTVLDPFLGSGSTAVAAQALGFNVIGCELHQRYAEIAQRRCIDDAGMFADVKIESHNSGSAE